MMNFLVKTGLSLAMAAAGGAAQAADVTPDVIFGSGNANGGFTVSTGTYIDDIAGQIALEIGLRAKLRFNDNNLPENTFNYDGVDTYTFDAKAPPSGFGFAPNSPGTAVWNFEWSVNTDLNFDLPAIGASSLNALTYELRLDGDPTAGTNFLVFDPINPITGFPTPDNAIGNNTTGNGDGTVAMTAAEYDTLINENQVAQNSGNYEFFNVAGLPLENFIGAAPGEYRIEFEAFFNGQSVASTGINVNSVAAVPLPAGLPLLATALLGFGFLRLRRKS